MKNYKLEKLSIKEGHSSAVVEGSVSESSKHVMFKVGDSDETLEFPEIKDITVGGMLLVFGDYTDFIKTSPITKIVETTENSLTFETRTSVYKLEISDE